MRNPEVLLFFDHLDTLPQYAAKSPSCEIRHEILRYSMMFDRADLQRLASAFNGVIGDTQGIDGLILAFDDDGYRSVTSRLACLLVMSDDRYGMLANRRDGSVVTARLMASLLSRAMFMCRLPEGQRRI